MIKITLLSIVYFVGAAFIAASSIGDLFAFQVVYRIIYVPLIFWALTIVYAYLFHRVNTRKINTSMIAMLGIPLHLTLLLSNTYFSVVSGTSALGRPYKLYIEAVLYILVFLTLIWGVRIIKDSFLSGNGDNKKAFLSPFFLPALYIFPYVLYLAVGYGEPRMVCTLLLGALTCFLIKSNEKFFRLLKTFFKKAMGLFESERRVVLLIFIVAFSARLLFGINIINQTQNAFPTGSDDGVSYDKYAYRIAKDPSYIRSPEFTPTGCEIGYSLFLALLYKIFGRSFYIVVVIQSIIGAFVPILVYLLSNMIIRNRAVAVSSAIWTSMDQPLIMHSSVLAQEALYIPLLTYLIYLITRCAVEKNDGLNISRSLLMGMVVGVSLVVRSAILYFVPLFTAYLFFLKNKKSLLVRAAGIALILCIIVILVAPVTYLNYLNSGKFYLLTLPKIILDWEQFESGGYFSPSNMILAKMGINPLKDIKGSMVNIARDPMTFLSVGIDLLSRRYIGFFFCYNFGYFDPIYMVNPSKIANRFASSLEFYLSLSVLIGFILMMTNKDLRRKAWPVFLILFYYAFLHIVMIRMGNSRYRAPINPYLIMFGSLAIVRLTEYIRKGFASNEDTFHKSEF